MRCAYLLSTLFALAFIFPVSARATEETGTVQLVRIWPSWRDTASFLRISEYFGGGENRSRQTILRTQPDERAGFYFLVRIKNADSRLSTAHFELQVIRPDAPHVRSYRFPVTLDIGSHVYNLGLTGSDWPGLEGKAAEDTHPVAWALRLLDGEGQELAHRESFLWAKP